MDLSAPDHVADQRRVQQNLDGRQAAAVLAHHQALGNDRAQVQGQVHQDVAVRGFGEEVEDALEGLVGIVRMQGGQAQVTGFRE